MKKNYNFEFLFNDLTSESSLRLRRLDINTPLSVYYGLSQDGNFRLSFKSCGRMPKLAPTKLLNVIQGKDEDGEYWLNFDLIDAEAKKVFFTFCDSLIDSISGDFKEEEAIQNLRRRYACWKKMFKKENNKGISKELIQGLFGELFFLNNYLISKYGFEDSINSWCGPDMKSKDFSLKDAWFEIKTIGANTAKIIISSVSQLSSDLTGYLVVIKVESMSDVFDQKNSDIQSIFNEIVSNIDDESLLELFIRKMELIGYDVTNEEFNKHFSVKNLKVYKVNDEFPRIKENDFDKEGIDDISYSIILNSLKKYEVYSDGFNNI